MRKSSYVAVSAVALCLFAAAAQAQQHGLYLSAKAGSMDADFSGFDPAVNIGVGIGYDVYSDRSGVWSAEGEFTTTVSDGDISGGGEWDARTVSAYGVYRTPGDLYGKAKAGWTQQDVKRGGVGGEPISANDSSFSYGIGGGWRLNPSSALELEYTRATDDLNFLNIGYVFRY